MVNIRLINVVVVAVILILTVVVNKVAVSCYLLMTRKGDDERLV